jgi:long-chain acyl-CoA synthetase
MSNPAWPARSVAQSFELLTRPGAPFELEEKQVGDRRVRTYKSTFPHLRAVLEQGLVWGDREYLVYEGERLTFSAHHRAVAALARVLLAQYGVRKGDRIAIAMRAISPSGRSRSGRPRRSARSSRR